MAVNLQLMNRADSAERCGLQSPQCGDRQLYAQYYWVLFFPPSAVGSPIIFLRTAGVSSGPMIQSVGASVTLANVEQIADLL